MRRLARQGLARLDGLAGLVRRRRYDRARPGNLVVTKGALPPGPHMAIFLIYQPAGLAGSIPVALAALCAAGAVPLVISNTALSAADRTALTPQVWRVVERPNTGYDFGGYREGIAQLHDAGLDPALLWILNDSGWFPSCGGPDRFAAMIAPAAAMSGGMFRFLKGGREWIESYFLHVPARTRRHPAFGGFFRRYPLLNLKYAVVRHGEMGLGRALRRGGLRVDSKVSNARFISLLQDQPPAFLRRMLDYGGLVPVALQADRARILAMTDTDPAWSAAVIAHVRASLERSEFYYQFPYASVHLLGFPFIKKGPDPRYMVWRRQHLAAVRAGDLPPLPPAIQTELAAAVARDAAKADVDWRLPAG